MEGAWVARRPDSRSAGRLTEARAAAAITLPRPHMANQRAQSRRSLNTRPCEDWRSRPLITAFAGSFRSLVSCSPPSLYRQYAGRAAIRQLVLRFAQLRRADSCRTACSAPNGAGARASPLQIDAQSLLHTRRRH